MIQIRQGVISEVVQLTRLIPEFENVYEEQEYHRRLDKCFHIILVAELKGKPVGFKVGYAMDQHVFYSWMGGVLPSSRRLGIAKKLAEYQEEFLKREGFKHISMKTRNRLKEMLHFALSSDFYIEDIIKKDYSPGEYRIKLKKDL